MISGIERLEETLQINPENTRFFLTPTGLLMLERKDTGESQRAFLARAFPFETEEEYVSVLNEDKEEVGMIRRLSDFGEEAELLRQELRKKYFSPKIKKIKKLTERYGASHWECETDCGDLNFTVRDTYRSLIRAGEDRVFVVDCDGCRYEIESLKGMDKKSYSKIDLYL